MKVHVFSGTPAQIGAACGMALAEPIRSNLRVLVWREGHKPLPREDRSFQDWWRGQEDLVRLHWPWMLEEIAAVGEAVGASYEDMLLLNLRAWQYEFYGAKPTCDACTSLAVTLSDGTIASAGALDDPIKLYCGPVKVEPSDGHRFISFPITGTCWGSRGINSAGLSLGVSSQVLPGLIRKPNTVSQDLAGRAILQTCQTAAEVRTFCQQHPFTMNVVVVDAAGEVACIQNSAAGPLELPFEGYAAITNHIVRDEDVLWLHQRGATQLPQRPDVRARRGAALNFCRQHNGRCTDAQVRAFVSEYHGGSAACVHNKGTIYLTVCNPQVEPNAIWVQEGFGAVGRESQFERLEI